MGKKPLVGSTRDRRRQALAVAILACGALAEGGCGRPPKDRHAVVSIDAAQPEPEIVPPPPPPPPDPGRVHVLLDGEPQSLNPDLDPDVWTFRLAYDAIYEPLIRARTTASDAGETHDGAAFDDLLADRYTVEDEGQRILFHLRPGVTFHDGKPLAVTDVAFTFDRLQSGKTHAPRIQGSLSDLDHVELVNRETVRFVVRKPSAYLLSAIAEVAILPEHVFGKGELAGQPVNRHPVGTGPLKFSSWERGKHLVLARNDAYWGEKAQAEEIDIEFESDGVKALGRARRGEVDVVSRVPPAYVPEQLDSPSLRSRFEPLREEESRFSFVLWNVQRPPFDQVAVRRAISVALDRVRLLDDARHGLGRPIATVPLGFASPPAKSDVALAQRMLDEAGLARGPGGFRQRGPGRPIRVSLLVPSGSREAEASQKAVTDVLARLGLPADVTVTDLPSMIVRMKKGTFDGALLSYAPREPADVGTLFHTRAPQNFGGFNSKELDGILDILRRPPQAENGVRGEARRGFEKRLAAMIFAEQPALFLYSPDELHLYARRLRRPRLLGDFFLLRDVGPR